MQLASELSFGFTFSFGSASSNVSFVLPLLFRKVLSMGKEISQDLRQRIVNLHNEGLGYRKISAQLGVPLSSVGTIIRAWKCRNTTLNKPKTGRPRNISERAARKLVRTVVQRPHTTRNELREDLVASGVDVSKFTISRALRREGVRSRTARKTPLLQKRHVKARLLYANYHLSKPEAFWDSV